MKSKLVILITGTSSGIGFSLAEYFGSKGHIVFGLSRKNTISNLFTTIPTDITDEIQLKQAVDYILSKVVKIDVLINNAGRGMVGSIEDAQKDEITQLFNLNVTASVQTMQVVLPNMRKHMQGKIINISSIGSEMGLPYRGFYSASKSALDKITEAIRYEVYTWNIEVTSLHLGDIKTKIADNRVISNTTSPYKQTFNSVYSLINAHVDEGTEPNDVAEYINKLLNKKKWKAHYYYGKLGQKIGVSLKHILPQNLYEYLMKKYNKLL